MSERFCFVISPIGSQDSVERTQADDFLNLIKEIGELHGLEVKRADEIIGNSDINADVIEKIQCADLCIVDLTGLNPNVMYEFGMRYQSGLPYIVCAREKTKLPFDLISRRTIFYGDLSNAVVCRETKKKIRDYIKVFEEKEYKSIETVTMTDLYSMLKVLLDKVDCVRTQSYSMSSNLSIPTTSSIDDILRELSPSEAFRYAYSTNQIKLAEELLEYCRDEPYTYFRNKLCALATLGSDKAAMELEQHLHDTIANAPFDDILEVVGCLVSCYNRRDSEKEHIDSMVQVFAYVQSKAQTNRERAAILNQKERLFAGASDYETAKQIAEEVIALNDEEPSYFFNYAAVLNQLGNDKEAVVYAKKAVDLQEGEDDADHLYLLCSLLKRLDNPSDLELLDTYIKRLEKINPFKARLVRLR